MPELSRCVATREGASQDYESTTMFPVCMAPAFSKRPGQQIANRSDGLAYAVTTGEPARVLTYRKSRRAQTSEDSETWVPADVANTVNCFDVGDIRATEAVVEPTMGVRRLTPMECERLMGFPDNFTRIPYRGKPASDGPRYKALGNSFAVPVVRWIGERIQQVSEVIRGD